jgi:hypothetical protein
VGTVSNVTLSKPDADAQAERMAEEKLHTMLSNECDVVPCPECGAITPEMEKARKRFFPQMLLVIAGGAGLLLLVFVAWLLTGRIYLLPSIVGAGIFLLGCLVLVMRSKEMILAGRRRRC